MDEGDELEGEVGSPRRLGGDDSQLPWWIAMPLAGCCIWCALPLLIWKNERLSVKQEAYLKKAKDHCIIIDDINVEPPDELVDHVVFLTGTASQKETLVDSVFSMVKAENAVKLNRTMQKWAVTYTNKDD